MATTTGKLYLGSTLVSGGGSNLGWTRPSDWLTLPNFSSDQGFVGLYAVFEHGSNFVAFTVAGNFTVDWGDGTTENFASGTTVYKNLSWSSYNSNTLSSRGYRQAIIKVTPQDGNNITSINLNVRHNQTSLQNYVTGWLDLIINGPNLSTLTISASSTNVRQGSLEKIEILNIGTVSTFASLFNECRNLASITISANTSSVTSTSSMFNNCDNLRVAPMFNTINVTTMASMFADCESLIEVPLYDTQNATSMNSMFATCESLTEVPFFNTIKNTTMNFMFQNCSALLTIPLFNTANVTNAAGIFFGCSRLKEVPGFNFTKATTTNGMFNFCYALQKVGNITTSISLTNAGFMFNNNNNIQEVPALNLSSVTSTNLDLIVSQCQSMSSFKATGMNVTFSVINCRLSASALNEIYTNLSATGSGKTISVSGNWGTATDTPTIATAKGWTVIG